jgi:DNA-binding SARP family transcriptional activator
MELRVLGPVEVLVDGQPVVLPAKPRALLALLALRHGRVASVDELVDGLWGDEPPETAAKALQVYVSQLRKALGADRVVTRPPGYALRLEDGELDVDRFEQLVGEERYADALALWRGPALAEFAAEPFARDAAARLENERLGALEERIDADLALGRHDRLVPELEQLVAEHPARERLAGQLMLALYRSGRQAEALDVYRRTRRALSEDLGLEPGPELRDLERRILQQDPSLRQASPTAAGPATRSRRLLVAGAVGAVAVVAVALSLALTRGGSGGDPEVRAFVVKVENFLAQSRQGRQAVVATLAAESKCRLTPRAAAAGLDRVTRNRQSLLEQAAALAVPANPDAQRASDFLQRSIQASIEADWHYRDWLLARTRCGKARTTSDLKAALDSDARASRAKRSFVATFNPLAQRYGQRAWSDWEF